MARQPTDERLDAARGLGGAHLDPAAGEGDHPEMAKQFLAEGACSKANCKAFHPYLSSQSQLQPLPTARWGWGARGDPFR